MSSELTFTVVVLLCMCCIAFCQFDPEIDAISIRTIGFSSKYAKTLLQSLIDKTELKLVEQSGAANVYSLDSLDRHVLMVNDNDRTSSVKYDACLLYLDPLLLRNDELASRRLLAALDSLYDFHTENDKTDFPTLIIVFSYSEQLHLQKFVKFLNEGISLHEGGKLQKIVSRMNEITSTKPGAVPSAMTPDFNLRTVNVPFNRQIGKKVVAEFKEFLSNFESPGTSVSDAKEGETLTEPVVSVPSRGGNRTVASFLKLLNKKQSVSSANDPTDAVNRVVEYSHFEEYLSVSRQLLAKAKEELRRHPLWSETGHAVSAELFRSIADKQIQSILSQLRERVKGSTAAAAAASLSLVQAKVTQELLEMWSPVFAVQLQLHSKQVVRDFNAEFKSFYITVNVERDLLQLRDKLVRRFEEICRTLTPSAAVTLSGISGDALTDRESVDVLLSIGGGGIPAYNAHSAVKSINDSVTAFVNEKINYYKSIGVAAGAVSRPGTTIGGFALPSIELSVHSLVHHPLNLRDSRQDVLTGPESGDEVVLRRDDHFDLDNGRVTPVTVRKALQEEIKQIQLENAGSGILGRIRSYFQTRGLKEKSEFAREMLMLPLSLRDHRTRLYEGNNREDLSKQSSRDSEEFRGHPEQFLKWSMPGLSEAMESVLQLQKETRQPTNGPEDGLRGALVDRWMKSSKSPNKYSDKGLNYQFDPSDPHYVPRGSSLFGRVSSIFGKRK